MKRREFFRTAALSGTGAALSSWLSCGGERSRRTDIASFELAEWTCTAMQSGDLTSREITEQYLSRIRDVDQSGPALNAILEINPDAADIAAQLDHERQAGTVRGPLHGIPVILKDNIDTADKMMTTAGSLALQGWHARQDAFIVEKLRKAGAVILAKANLSEWANFRSLHSSSGWSGRGGQTRNPYVLDRNPCGSSSGSAVAVSANLCALAVGTETNGSVVCPANANGIVGIKPTVGLLGRSGIIPISATQDTAGAMARTVADAALMLTAMAGADPRDKATQNKTAKSHPDYTRYLKPDGMQGARIGVARNFFGFLPQVDELMQGAIKVMRDLNAEIVDTANIETSGTYGRAAFDLLLYEFKDGINAYLKGTGPDQPKTLSDLIAFNRDYSDQEMPYFGQEIFEMAQEKGDLSSPEYREAMATVREKSRDEGIDATLRKHNVDALIAPTGSPAWPTDWINGDHFLGGSSSPAARAGYPNITVPAGFVHGLPVGISFFSGAWQEPLLIRLAYAYEQASGHRNEPQFLKRIA
ncbi:MAG: amidase [candidate division KSB1 bacterium]|nr:amidase [candidate division KSB1 bacterium]